VRRCTAGCSAWTVGKGPTGYGASKSRSTIAACLLTLLPAGTANVSLAAATDTETALRMARPAKAGEVGTPAPDFSRADLAGRRQRLADYRGRTLLLDFWASWCAPCVAELPHFSAWQKRYGADGLRVIGVSMDDDAHALDRFLQRSPVAFPVVRGDAALARRFGGVFGLPLAFLIDSEGRIVERIEGDADLVKLESAIVRRLRPPAGRAAR
jgi:thiol-disulfide isomerase/thioredoxin